MKRKYIYICKSDEYKIYFMVEISKNKEEQRRKNTTDPCFGTFTSTLFVLCDNRLCNAFKIFCA